jgi:copper chaperone NosL
MPRSLLLALCLAAGCTAAPEPRPIAYGSDVCDWCRMTITRESLAAQIVPARGAVKRFDEPGCMLRHAAAAAPGAQDRLWVHDAASGRWIDARTARFVVPSRDVQGMMYGVLAYADHAHAEAARGDGSVVSLDSLLAAWSR